MSRKSRDVKIGLFVLAAAGLLVAGLLAFGLRDAFRPHYYFETYVPGEVSGLSVGSPVLLSGVPIGKVKQITFSWMEYPDYRSRYVVVVGEVSPVISQEMNRAERDKFVEAEIGHGLRARIQSQGVTGTSVVALEYLDPKRHPPLSVPWQPKRLYIPSAPSQFRDIVQQVQTTLDKLSAVDFPGLGASANGLIGELRHTNGQIKILLEETTSTLASGNLPALFETTDRTLAQLRETSAGLNEALGDLRRYPAGFFFGQPPPRPSCLESPKK